MYSTDYMYRPGEELNQTTGLVDVLTYWIGEDIQEISYSYDDLGNISSTMQSGATESYTYDDLNQLKTVTRGSDVYEYTYDNGGNILSVKKNGTVVKSYTYGDSQWKDLLTAYNGNTITYDNIGNPLTYYNGSTFTWAAGRKLASFTNNYGDIYEYRYDADGHLISKDLSFEPGEVIESLEHTWIDGRLYYMGNDFYSMEFTYDESGRPFSMYCVGPMTTDTVYYMYNLQGDVIALITDEGDIVVEYTYDEWGKCTMQWFPTGDDDYSDIGELNPFRYRGYYYDNATGFYHCGTRFYDPNIGRWINVDGFVSTGQGVRGYNMFVYCLNCPVTGIDFYGNRAYFINGINNDEESGPPPYAKVFEQKLEELGAEDVIPIPVFNNQSGLWGIIKGSFQVICEALNYDLYTSYIIEMINKNLKANPLKEGETISLIGYSGGGQLALNVMEAMEGQIDNVVLIGTPVAEIGNTETKVHMIYSKIDFLSWNLGCGYSLYCIGMVGHTSYFSKKYIDRLAEYTYKVTK